MSTFINFRIIRHATKTDTIPAMVPSNVFSVKSNHQKPKNLSRQITKSKFSFYINQNKLHNTSKKYFIKQNHRSILSKIFANVKRHYCWHDLIEGIQNYIQQQMPAIKMQKISVTIFLFIMPIFCKRFYSE